MRAAAKSTVGLNTEVGLTACGCLIIMWGRSGLPLKEQDTNWSDMFGQTLNSG